MSIARKAFLNVVPILSLLTMALVATPGRAAVSVVLECSGFGQNEHMLYELDYAAGTVHQHAVDDYGGPSTESTGDHIYPAQITDKEIAWTEYETGDGSFERDRLGRYSGVLTIESNDPNRTPAYYSTNSQCKPYVAPTLQRKF